MIKVVGQCHCHDCWSQGGGSRLGGLGQMVGFSRGGGGR